MENGRFLQILQSQEKSDLKESADEELFFAEIKRQFVNSQSIIEEARARRLTLSRFQKSGAAKTNFSFLPIRTEKHFSVKKHTSSQRPYFHGHDYYELIFVFDGTCRQTLADGKDIMHAGQCMLLCPGTAHSIERCGKGDIILKLSVPADLFERTAETFPQFKGLSGAHKFAANEGAKLLVLKLLFESQSDDGFTADATECYLKLLFVELARGNAEACNGLIESIREYACRALKSANLKDYAYMCGYNASYLSRLIKERTGKTFSQILSQLRLNEACRLLAGTDMSVESIAAEVGYANASALYKIFCPTFGVTPAQYRSALLER